MRNCPTCNPSVTLPKMTIGEIRKAVELANRHEAIPQKARRNSMRLLAFPTLLAACEQLLEAVESGLESERLATVTAISKRRRKR